MNIPPRAGRAVGRAPPSLRHAQRAKLQRTNPGSSPLDLRGILSRQPGPALSCLVIAIRRLISHPSATSEFVVPFAVNAPIDGDVGIKPATERDRALSLLGVRH